MARFSQGLLQGLMQPAFGQNLYEVGRAAAAGPAMTRASQRMKEQREQEDLARRGLLTNALSGTLTPEVLAERAGERGVSTQDILQGLEIQETVQQRGREAEERRKQPIQERGKGRLKAIAMNDDFDPQNDKMLNGYLGMAEAMLVSPDEAMDILKEAKGIGTKRVVKTDTVVLRDAVGNKFNDITTHFADGTRDQTTLAVAGNRKGKTKAGLEYTGEEPVGDTIIISRTSGVGGEDRPRLAQNVQESKDFGELKVQASDKILDLVAERDNIIAAVNLLDTFETEGIAESVANFIQREGGIQDPNKAEYELIVGEAMFSRLKPLFGGVISDSEREAIKALYANLKRGNPANKRILMRLKTIVEKAIQKQNLLRNSETLEDYNRKLDKFFEKTGTDNYIAPPESKEEKQQQEDVKYFWNIETQSLEPA